MSSYQIVVHSRSGVERRVHCSYVPSGFWEFREDEVVDPVYDFFEEDLEVEVAPVESIEDEVAGLEWLDFAPESFESYNDLVANGTKKEGATAVVAGKDGYREYVYENSRWRKK